MTIDDNVCGGIQTESNWVRGDWMHTFTGRAFYPLDPRPDDIDERDIAHALSLVCRYGGHVKRFYSVAEHCVHIATYLLDTTGDAHLALWGLLHDAPEAYVGDMVRPLKRQIPQYQKIENGIMVAIAEKYGLPREDIFSVDLPAAVKDADNRILLTEKAALLSEPEIPWHPFFDTIEPLPVQIYGWSPVEAERVHLGTLRALLEVTR